MSQATLDNTLNLKQNRVSIIAEELSKRVDSPSGPLTILDGVSMTLTQGRSVAIVGASGSGKSTLLGLLAGLDLPTSGHVELLGNRLDQLTEDQRAGLRGRSVGFVFQNFQLLPNLSALDNVALPLELRGVRRPDGPALEWLKRVGLGDRAGHLPLKLSGGEQQRVAIARAIAKRPEVMLCDEPTGALDSKTGVLVLEALSRINVELKTTMAIITHNAAIREIAHRVLTFKDGRIAEASVNAIRAKPSEVSW